MTRVSRRLLPSIASILAVGCAGDAPARDGYTVRDSAGVSIAENRDSAWTSAVAWRIEPEPFLVIGSRDGASPGTDFTRITHAARLSDGRIVAADATSRELRVFGAGGEFLFRMGGPGEGPGEFRMLDRIAVLRGDSIVARDVGAFRHVVFGPDGTPVRTVSGPPILWNGLVAVYVAGWLRDGAYVVSHSPQSSELPPGRNLIETEWHYFDPAGAHVGRIGRMPVYHAHNIGMGRGPIRLGPRAAVRVTGTGLWYGFPETYELRFYTPAGLERIVRRTWTPEPVPERARESYRTWFAEEYAPDIPPTAPPSAREQLRALYEARLEEMTFADTLPAFASFMVATDGHLWVQEHASAEQLGGSAWTWSAPVALPCWSVFSAEGRWLGTVSTPEDLRVLEIGEDYVMGARTDELDVPYLALHRIAKPDTP